MRTIAALVTVAVLLAAPAVSAQQAGRCSNGRSKSGAMWLSIAHPGLGEWYLKDWGPIDNAPQLKFWLGFIPLYGWPGYLQVKSAVDAHHCRTNDRLKWGAD